MKPCVFAIMSPGADYRECGAPSRYICRASGAHLCEDHAEDFREMFGEPLDAIEPSVTSE